MSDMKRENINSTKYDIPPELQNTGDDHHPG